MSKINLSIIKKCYQKRGWLSVDYAEIYCLRFDNAILGIK